MEQEWVVYSFNYPLVGFDEEAANPVCLPIMSFGVKACQFSRKITFPLKRRYPFGQSSYSWGRTSGNLVDLPWLMFVKNVGMLKLLLMVESLLEILTNERSQMFGKSMDVYSVKNAINEIKLDMTFFVVTCSCR